MIAISYRRDDSLAITGRLYDRLRTEFGKDRVFMDLDSIAAGADFREQIRQIISRAQVLIAVIGSKWRGPRDDGSYRINDDGDVVRIEIASALAQGIPIIPLMVNNTSMPSPTSLPADIQELAFRNALPLDSGMDFHVHVDRLVAAIRKLVSPPGRRSIPGRSRLQRSVLKPAIVLAGAVFAVTVIGIGGWLMFGKHSPRANSTVSPVPVRQTSLTEASATGTPSSPEPPRTRSNPLDMALTAPPAGSNQWSDPVSIPEGMQCYWESERNSRGDRKPLWVLVNGSKLVYWDGRNQPLGNNVSRLEFRSASADPTVVMYRLMPLGK